MVVVFCGTPGSGKSTLYRQYYTTYYYISPDALRKEICGNINDQSRNKEIWEMAYDKLKEACTDSTNNICFDATNVKQSYLENILNIANSYGHSVQFVFFTDSCDYKLCRNRIEKDISEGVDRSNVPEEVSKNMRKNFLNLLANIYDLEKIWEERYTINITITYYKGEFYV